MTGRTRPTYAEVDLDAIAHNVRVVRERIAPAEVIAVVKADGYGHGAIAVARTALAAGATWLAVALVEEGEELRAAGISAPVLLLAEPPPDAAPRVVASDLTPTVYTTPFAQALRAEAARNAAPVSVHVKADTGMARVGVPRDEWDPRLGDLKEMQPELEVGAVWTHFACADEPGHPSVRGQLEHFAAFLERARSHDLAPPRIHLGNSAAALTLDPAELGDAVRLGIAMYGVPPSPALVGAADLRPALRFVSEVAYVKRVHAGTPASYGHTWAAPADGWLATVPVGYADGVPRLLSNQAEALVGGSRRLFAGTVCMDQILLWCGDDRVAPGEEVVLIGRQGHEEVTATEWAQLIGTIGYEIVTGISRRVPRVHRDGIAEGVDDA